MTPADRLAAHWAAQLVASVGAALEPPRPDDSHTALSWDAARRAFVGARGAALIVEELALVADGARLELAGRSREEALAWLGARYGAEIPAYPHTPPGDPPARFPAPSAGQRELADRYALAARVLEPLQPPLRTWPHHFDMAKLLELGGGRTIGAGLSPGDSSYDEPYFYVTPYPHPEARTGPALPLGRWHVEGWFGAVLVGPRDEGAARTFVEAAISACRTLLS